MICQDLGLVIICQSIGLSSFRVQGCNISGYGVVICQDIVLSSTMTALIRAVTVLPYLYLLDFMISTDGGCQGPDPSLPAETLISSNMGCHGPDPSLPTYFIVSNMGKGAVTVLTHLYTIDYMVSTIGAVTVLTHLCPQTLWSALMGLSLS